MQEYIEKSWYRAIQEAADANAGISLCLSDTQTSNDATTAYYSTRMLEIKSNGSLILERPDQPGASSVCQGNVPVDLFVRDNDQCWAGQCSVVDTLSYELNKKRNIHAIELAPATKIWSGQRREFYRVDTIGSDLDPVSVTPIGHMVATLHLLDDSGRPKTTDTFKAHLCDVSGGGIGLRLHSGDVSSQWVRIKQRFSCLFKLSAHEPYMEAELKLQRIEKIEPDLLHLGMTFDMDDPNAMRRIQDRMVRFTADLQRTYLRRKRGA